jgi:hypothetical protein
LKIFPAGLAALAALVLALAPSGSAAVTCDVTWTSGASGNWSDATKWTFANPAGDADGVPDSDEHVCIQADGTYTVTADAAGIGAKSVTLGHGTSGTQTLAVQASGFNLSTAGTASTINATGVLSAVQEVAFAGDLTVHGTIGIPSDTSSRMLRNGTGTFDLAGGTIAGVGRLSLSGGTFKHGNGGTIAGSAPRLQSVNLDLSGSGTGTYDLSGTSNHLTADIAANKTVNVTGNGANATLIATAQRTNNGTIVLRGATSGHFGTLSSGNHDFVNGALGTIRLAAGPGGTSLDAHLDNRGLFDVDESGSTGSKRLKNTGTIDIAAGAGFALFNGTTEFDGSSAVTGSGQFSQSGGTFAHKGGTASSTISLWGLSSFDPSGPGSAAYDVGGTTTLTGNIPSGRTITVDGGELVTTATRTNAGTIRLAGSGASTLGSAAHQFTNSGTIETTHGASRTVASPLASTGTIAIGGETLFDGGFSQTAGTTTVGSDLHVPAGLGLAGGALEGSGTVVGDVQNTGGTVRPAGTGSTGRLAVDGDYAQGSGGTLAAEVQGVADEDGHDQLAVSGTASLGGTLAIDAAGYTPPDDGVFRIVDALAARTGTFASATGLASAAGDKSFNVVYEANAVELTVNPADADDDGSPDGSDCDDANPNVKPGGTEIPGNGLDDDCVGGDEQLPPPDSDGDGVPDASDQCKDEKGTLPNGCNPPPADPDSDGDGVPDSTDPEPNDPAVPGAFGATNGDNVLNGTAAANLICGLLGNDTVNGLAGNDTLYGDACGKKARIAAAQSPADGNDKLNGGDGNDLLYGAGGKDSLKGGRGNDKLFGGAGNDSLNGEAGKDTLDGGAGNDKLTGGPDANSYKGGPGDDSIAARNGKRETVDCGSGKKDLATVDRADKVKGCERVKRSRK